jgi:hypothetical protein
LSIKDKVEAVMGLLESVNPKLRDECTVDYQTVDSALIYGPFPSFLILVDLIGKPRIVVHVNADAPNILYLYKSVSLKLDLVFDGAFAVDGNTGNIILGEEAYKKKEENILMLAQEIVARRASNDDGIVVPDKKIILTT